MALLVVINLSICTAAQIHELINQIKKAAPKKIHFGSRSHSKFIELQKEKKNQSIP
jgi:hypothetical protein